MILDDQEVGCSLFDLDPDYYFIDIDIFRGGIL